MTPDNTGASGCAPAGSGGPEPHFGSLKRAGGWSRKTLKAGCGYGPSLRTSTLRNGRRSTSGGRVSLAGREGGGEAFSAVTAGGCRSALRLSFQGSELIARSSAGSGCGTRTTFGRPRGRFGVAAGSHSPAASRVRGRPGLRRAGAASVSVGVSGTSGAGSRSLPPGPHLASDVWPWRQAAARGSPRSARPRAGRRCSGQVGAEGRRATTATPHSGA